MISILGESSKGENNMKKRIRKQDRPTLCPIFQDGQFVYTVIYPNGKIVWCWEGKEQAERKINEYLEQLS